jgi:hypothetical protein
VYLHDVAADAFCLKFGAALNQSSLSLPYVVTSRFRILRDALHMIFNTLTGLNVAGIA